MIYDAVIVGGGMVGATLALASPKQNIALIDATPLASKEDPRLIALTYRSCCLFKNLGVWHELLPFATPIKQLHVSKRGKFGITRIHHQEINLPNLGYVIPAKYINAALNKKLSSSHVEIIRPATLKNLSQSATNVTLEIEKNAQSETLTAKKVIAADGTHSTIRQLLQIETEEIDYAQSAIVTITQLQRGHNHIAYERFVEKGAIAMLPLSESSVATIWTDENTNINARMQLDDTAFLQTLQTHFGYRLGRLCGIGTRYTFPLHFIRAKEIQKQHVTLIGNALHTIHPLAAQGLNIALYEVAALAESLQQNTDKIDFTPMNMGLKLSHHLNNIFSADKLLFNSARSLSMLGLDILSPAKSFLMHKTMGKRCPHLLQDKEVYEVDRD